MGGHNAVIDSVDWINELGLEPHPEGGFFREVYRAEEKVNSKNLPACFGGDRSLSTAIYFLLRNPDVSVFHRLKQDELWHFYDGDPLTVHIIKPSGEYLAGRLGKTLKSGHVPMVVVRAGWLFGAAVDVPGGWTLAGCTVSPGFEYCDFDMPGRSELLNLYPEHADIINKLTRQ